LKDTKSTIIKEHLSELKKHSEKNHYYDILKKNDKYDEGGNSDRDYSDKEFIMIMDVKNSTGTGAYEEVISKSKEYERKSDNKNFKVEIYGYLIDAYVKLNLLDDAINVSDKLIDLDKKNPIFLLQKSNLIEGYDEKIKLIDAAIARDEYFYSTYLDKANLYEQKYYNLHMQDDFNEICRLYETSLKRDPSLRNPGWNGYCNFIEKSNIEKKEKENRISDIIVTMSDQNPLSIRVFKARLTLLKLGDKNAEAINSLLKEITDAKNVMPDHALLSYDIMYLSVLDYANYVDKIKDYLEVTDSNNSYKKKSKYQKYKASLVARKFGNIDEAIDILEKSLLVDTDTDSVVRIIKYLCYKSDIKKAEEVFDKYHRSMELGQRFVSRREIYEEKGDYDSAILEVKNTQKHADFSESLVTHMSYLLLLKKDYKSAKELCREYLEKVKFSQHAVSETINYEYASSMFKDGKVNKVRLQTIFDKNEDNLTRAAIKFLFSEKDECFKYINKAIAEDKTSKYLIRNWPIFSSLIGDTRWLALYS
jgi:tetratricopeptide (TPR) repeat protein